MGPPEFALASPQRGEERPNFRQCRIIAFTAACCYAKSAPRALQCGDSAGSGAPKRLAADGNPVSRPSENRPKQRPPRTAGAGLSKTCPLPEPFKRARPRKACLIFDLELFDIGGLGPGGRGPLSSPPPPPPRVWVGAQPRVRGCVLGA